MSRTIYVTCPECQELMEVDSQTGKVKKHYQSKKKEASADLLKEQIDSMKHEASKREEIFNKAHSEREKKLNQLDQLFVEEKNKIQKEGITKPKNIFDLE